jgi:8-oxo-dGTP pyrophosphatase MutT (NUDIX family)
MTLAACTLIYRPDGTFLAVTRRRDPRLLCLPGGKLDPGETLLDAAVRETAEESGVRVPPEALSLLFHGPCENDLGEAPEYEVSTFLAAWDEAWGPLQTLEANILPQWVTVAQFLQAGAMPIYNRAVLDAFAARVPDGGGAR